MLIITCCCFITIPICLFLNHNQSQKINQLVQKNEQLVQKINNSKSEIETLIEEKVEKIAEKKIEILIDKKLANLVTKLESFESKSFEITKLKQELIELKKDIDYSLNIKSLDFDLTQKKLIESQAEKFNDLINTISSLFAIKNSDNKFEHLVTFFSNQITILAKKQEEINLFVLKNLLQNSEQLEIAASFNKANFQSIIRLAEQAQVTTNSKVGYEIGKGIKLNKLNVQDQIEESVLAIKKVKDSLELDNKNFFDNILQSQYVPFYQKQNIDFDIVNLKKIGLDCIISQNSQDLISTIITTPIL